MKCLLKEIQTNWAFDYLVEERQKFRVPTEDNVLFISISPNPNTKHKIIRYGHKISIMYRLMTHHEQYEYLIAYITEVYLPMININSKIVLTFELGKRCDLLHVHMLIWDSTIQNEYDIKCLQHGVTTNIMTIKNNINKKRLMIDNMNNIVYVNDSIEERLKYIFKDYEYSNSHFKGMYYEYNFTDNDKTETQCSTIIRPCIKIF